jgi:hypothetical protein
MLGRYLTSKGEQLINKIGITVNTVIVIIKLVNARYKKALIYQGFFISIDKLT